jgi:hypothetical protein
VGAASAPKQPVTQSTAPALRMARLVMDLFFVDVQAVGGTLFFIDQTIFLFSFLPRDGFKG